MVVLPHKVISKTLYLNIFSKKRFTVDLIDDSKREITPTILFCLDHLLFNPLGVNNAHLLLDIYLDFKE